MEGIHLLKDLLQRGDWMVKLDLKILRGSNSPGASEVHASPLAGEDLYQFNCLPYSLSSAPQGVHEENAPSDCLAEANWLSDDYLHRQQPNYGTYTGGSSLSS